MQMGQHLLIEIEGPWGCMGAPLESSRGDWGGAPPGPPKREETPPMTFSSEREGNKLESLDSIIASFSMSVHRAQTLNPKPTMGPSELFEASYSLPGG